tara:strand:+ start:656 stop:1294 length:639 start_codon:yes stop_codon:yes gene_type:complete
MPPKKDPKEKKKKKYSHSDPRNRPRVKGSWRDKAKGDCFTVPSGKVVCKGSAGMNYKPTGAYRIKGRAGIGAYESRWGENTRYIGEGGEAAPRPRVDRKRGRPQTRQRIKPFGDKDDFGVRTTKEESAQASAINQRRRKVRENFAKNFKIEADDIFYNKKTGESVSIDNIQVKDLKLAPRIVVRGVEGNKTGKEALTKTAFGKKYQKKKPKK